MSIIRSYYKKAGWNVSCKYCSYPYYDIDDRNVWCARHGPQFPLTFLIVVIVQRDWSTKYRWPRSLQLSIVSNLKETRPVFETKARLDQIYLYEPTSRINKPGPLIPRAELPLFISSSLHRLFICGLFPPRCVLCVRSWFAADPMLLILCVTEPYHRDDRIYSMDAWALTSRIHKGTTYQARIKQRTTGSPLTSPNAGNRFSKQLLYLLLGLQSTGASSLSSTGTWVINTISYCLLHRCVAPEMGLSFVCLPILTMHTHDK